MTKQSSFKIFIALISFSFFLFSSSITAQKAVYGNGNIQQDKRLVTNFSQLNISLNGDIIIHTGQQSHVIVETDENILKMVTTNVMGNTLNISQKNWPEPSKKFIVHVYTPAITRIVSESWANIRMDDIEQEKLELRLDEGSIIANGKVEMLSVFSGQADLNLSKLATEEVDIELTGYAEMTLCCAESVKRNIDKKASFKLLSDSNQDKNVLTTKEPIEYINFTLVNNKFTRGHFVVRGPSARKFSYGFPLVPYFSKKERWPVGTKVYRETLSGSEVFLIEIKKSDENQRVNLFK